MTTLRMRLSKIPPPRDARLRAGRVYLRSETGAEEQLGAVGLDGELATWQFFYEELGFDRGVAKSDREVLLPSVLHVGVVVVHLAVEIPVLVFVFLAAEPLRAQRDGPALGDAIRAIDGGSREHANVVLLLHRVRAGRVAQQMTFEQMHSNA